MPRTRLSAKTDAAKDMAIRIKSQAYAIHGGLDGAARAAGTAHWMAAVTACSIRGTPYAATRDHAESLPTTPGSRVLV